MNRRNTLSIAPYYGGKGRMAHFIADRLNYDDSDIFVTPFGGMCRVLLNKPRHKIECYNDYSSGLTALMRILSDPVKSVEFIHRLDDETSYSEEEFDRQKIIFDSAENDLVEQAKNRIRQFLVSNKIVEPRIARRLTNIILQQTGELDEAEKVENENAPAMQEGLKKLEEVLKKDKELKEALEKDKKLKGILEEDKKLYEVRISYLTDWIEAYRVKKDNGIIARSSDLGQYVSDMDLAIATYVVFTQSRDGMGQAFSKEKFDSNDQYKKELLICLTVLKD